jgi:uncharacterized protein YbjT (DUF2867 family)
VHASVAGADRPTSVPHFESKRAIEAHIRALGIPATFLRPTMFMEDLTEKQYFPPASWGMMPKLVGATRPVKWVSIEDIAIAATHAFLSREKPTGAAISLVGDVKTMTRMWEWLANNEMPGDVASTRAYVAEPLTMKAWLETKRVKQAA